MAYRIVKLAGGRAQIQLIPNKCPFLFPSQERCNEPVRLSPGAVYCEEHKWRETAGCVEHDKYNCREEGCK